MNPNITTQTTKPTLVAEAETKTTATPPKNIPSTRSPGGMKGQIGMADDFDAPMGEEELALWCDAPIFPNNK